MTGTSLLLVDRTSTSPTRATDPTLPITVVWPERDNGSFLHWLIPGNWTRGRAKSYVAQFEFDGVDFTALRARRVYLRWQQGASNVAGWEFEDGYLVACERTDPEAERYWEITETTREDGASHGR